MCLEATATCGRVSMPAYAILQRGLSLPPSLARSLSWSVVEKSPKHLWSKPIDIDHSLSKRLRGLLRYVVADPAGDEAVLILARELIAIRCAVRMGCTVG